MMLSSSPYKKSSHSVSQLMQLVIFATIPGAIALFYFFGWGVWFNLIVCCSVAYASEWLIVKLRNRDPKKVLSDYSALLTAVLLALALPPLAPWWVATIGTLFAIVFAKHLYGGLGYNPFNPAMTGYVLLLISFPMAMTTWLPPQSIAAQAPDFISSLQLFFSGSDSQGNTLNYYTLNADGFTMATPLDEIKTSFSMGYVFDEIKNKPIFGDWQNVGWQWVNLAFLAGGLFLIVKKAISWHIPVSFLAAIYITSFLAHGYDPQLNPAPMIHLLSGATMLGAFFIATDPVSATTTNKGRIIFGAAIGFIVVMIRNYGGYPDAIAFAVLIMNMAAPLIDHYTQPKVYGSQELK
ncbi:electron transport complex subunit RsxD [Pleionea sediminis]|uniref:electron transport complex subunit RsxD n=1 Tax=Pleionea sediminis TaxID=2569479 RepID=UPI001184A581|nr:electron transport complex subunit RsxD [Pleionea sediminis]